MKNLCLLTLCGFLAGAVLSAIKPVYAVDAFKKGFIAKYVKAEPATDAEKALLRFARLITNTPYRNSPEEVQTLRDAGWTEPQIAEAVYITAMFAFFNRVANAFGLEDPGYFEKDGVRDPLAGFLPRIGDPSRGESQVAR